MSRSNDIAGLTTSILDGVTATEVGLGNVTNESKATMFASPTFTGTTNVSSGVTLPSNPTITLGSNTTFPSGHVVQTKSSFYNSTAISSATTPTTHSQGELTDFTPKLGTSGKLVVWWWMSGVYTTTNSIGALIGLRYSTDSFSSETKLGTSASDYMAGYLGYGQGIRKHTGMSVCTGLIDTPTASAFSVRFRSQTNSGTVYLNQDVDKDTMGIIIQEIAP